MATQVNPFHAGLGPSKRQTLAEIAAATYGTNTSRSQPRRSAVTSNVSAWLFDQDAGNSMDIDEPDIPRSDHGQPTSRRTRKGAPSQASHAGRIPHNSPYNKLKRKASCLDEDEADVIVVSSPPRSRRHGLDSPVVIDLTRRSRQQRKRSRMGHQDDDVIIVEPPAADIRRDLRRLAIGSPDPEPAVEPSAAGAQPRNRNGRRQQRTESRTASRDRRPPQPQSNSRAAVPEAAAAEISEVLNSVESVTHFFTLAPEIRDQIYRHLLVSPKPVHVMNRWTEVVRRFSRRGENIDINERINISILLVCRRTAEEGTRILYAENTFFYLLRDNTTDGNANSNGGGGGGGRRNTRSSRLEEARRHILNLAKYGHLIRHMAIELEPNRTEASHEQQMAKALEALVPSAAAVLGSPPPPLPSFAPIHLHTLTITISPLFQPGQRGARGSQGAAPSPARTADGRYLSVVGLFSRGGQALRALQQIRVNFLRIHVHVNSHLRSRGGDGSEFGDSATSSAADSDAESSDPSSQQHRPKHHHLEATLDLRYLPQRQQQQHTATATTTTTTHASPSPSPQQGGGAPIDDVDDPWANDELVRQRRQERAAEAERALRDLRRHIEEACVAPELVSRRGGFWEEHGAAERRRREERARHEARFDRDACGGRGGDEDEDDDSWRDGGGDGRRRPRWPTRSLIISIDKVGDQLRAYRA